MLLRLDREVAKKVSKGLSCRKEQQQALVPHETDTHPPTLTRPTLGDDSRPSKILFFFPLQQHQGAVRAMQPSRLKHETIFFLSPRKKYNFAQVLLLFGEGSREREGRGKRTEPPPPTLFCDVVKQKKEGEG